MVVLGQRLYKRSMETIKTNYPTVLSIAGSDSGGGAGIQADIKSISACGAYAASVITATTAQNTQGVLDIHAIPILHLEKQLEAVLSDIQIDVVKIGMLHSCEVIACVQEKLKAFGVTSIILDPVMVATSGDILIDDKAIECLKAFLPKATLITPNIPEATILLGKPIDKKNIRTAAREIGSTFKTSVLLKGGHLTDDTKEITDVLYSHKTDSIQVIKHQKINTKNTHGTGCSLSSSIAAFLSTGAPIETAVTKACDYIHNAIKTGKNKQLGKGHGPINHFNLD